MNEQAQQLISDLALQLGTTAEYLWGVMVGQAHLHAITVIIICTVLSLACLTAYIATLRQASDKEAKRFMGWATFILIVLIWVCTLGDIVSALYNPEYWALQQILGKI